MREEDFLKLKSGTDVRGTALGEKTDLTDEAVDAIVRAFLYWIEDKTGNRAKIIAVGHDSRLSAGAHLQNGSFPLRRQAARTCSFAGCPPRPRCSCCCRKKNFAPMPRS